jgi:tetratricopeptide (TPR) repeat protein
VRHSITIALLSAAMALAASGPSFDETNVWARAHALYQSTDYNGSLALLLPAEKKDWAAFLLIGRDFYMLGDYRKASESLEHAAALAPNNADCWLWLGRAYGRRAETAGPFTAAGYASKTRQMFERAVALDPSNRAAIEDLFDYYLQAPGFLGGGENKAAALAAQMARQDPAQGHYYQALIDEQRKQYDSAEEHLRAALELAPRQVGRLLDLAKHLAMRGRAKESDALFEEAERIAPGDPGILYEHAQTYIRDRRNLVEARRLLQRYLSAPLTPNDPPRSDAQALLGKIGVVADANQ